jgi:solute carrier family 25 phosphate transporter 3
MVKTRLQGPQAKTMYNGSIDAFGKIARTEGVSALFLGIKPTVIGFYLQGGCKFGLFEFNKHTAVTHFEDFVYSYPFPTYLLCSAAAETIASTLLVPWEALRIRTVLRSDFPRGVVQGLKTVVAQEGSQGLYRGLGPLLCKHYPYTMTQLSVFTYIVDQTYNKLLPRWGYQKEKMTKPQQLGVSIGCGVVAGVAASLASHPGDTVLTRINLMTVGSVASTAASASSVRPAPPTIRTVLKDLGFRGLWTGTGLRCIYTGTMSAGMFLVVDAARLALGLHITTGLPKRPTPGTNEKKH